MLRLNKTTLAAAAMLAAGPFLMTQAQASINPLIFQVWDIVPDPQSETVDIIDHNFTSVHLLNVELDQIERISNPAVKATIPSGPNPHLLWYRIEEGLLAQQFTVNTLDQFGPQNVTVQGPKYLLVPAEKNGPEPEGQTHYACYQVTGGGTNVNVMRVVQDQFDPTENVTVGTPSYVCNAVTKIHLGMTHKPSYPYGIIFYNITPDTEYAGVDPIMTDQFITNRLLDVTMRRYLGVRIDSKRVPAMSRWGVGAMVLLTLGAATVVLVRRQRNTAPIG